MEEAEEDDLCDDVVEESGSVTAKRVFKRESWQHQSSEELEEAITKLRESKTNSRKGVLDSLDSDKSARDKKLKGTFSGVFVPTCENMWGVLIFLRFYWIVGHAGVGLALVAVFLSFAAAFCTVSSMAAIVSSGGHVSEGGPYYMISRAMGPVVGVTVGLTYWLGITLLSVLECLGAVEAMLMASPSLYFPGSMQVYGSALMLLMVLFVYAGINFVTKLGVFFVVIVFYTLASYYVGLGTAPLVDMAKSNPCVTGLSVQTLLDNFPSHFGEDVTFGKALSVFYPCFTGILSGANRADVLRDPPKNIVQGTFAAIIFSLVMYSSFMVLWGSVAHYKYLQGKEHYACGGGRRLAGGSAGAYLVESIVWNPFPHSAHIGIIISSLSQSLQCLIVAPRLLQSIGKDRVVSWLNFLAPLSSKGEPVRGLLGTYVCAGLLVLIGDLNLVSPLLSIGFLVAYAGMNISCFTLTLLRSPAWRPYGVHRKRWRRWYKASGGMGFCICLVIMFIVAPYWAAGALVLTTALFFLIRWQVEAKEWGSAIDGIRFNLALKSLIALEHTQSMALNWRPQILILYRVHLSQELRGEGHREILHFYSCLRKGDGFCVVACVLPGDKKCEETLRCADKERDVIHAIMDQENLQGFATVVVAPSWAQGTNYVIQLTGIGGLVPNTVLVDWPHWVGKGCRRATEFVEVLTAAVAKSKSVLAVKGLQSMPTEPVYGTIDIWWVVHDGGFMILLSWLLVNHRIWRNCQLRIFTMTEHVEEEIAKSAAEALTKILKQRRLAHVAVEVIMVDAEVLEPFSYNMTLGVERRNMSTIPQTVEDLFKMKNPKIESSSSIEALVKVTKVKKDDHGRSKDGAAPAKSVSDEAAARRDAKALQPAQFALGEESTEASDTGGAGKPAEEGAAHAEIVSMEVPCEPDAELFKDTDIGKTVPEYGREHLRSISREGLLEIAEELNTNIRERSRLAQLVIINLPQLWGIEEPQVMAFMSYCEACVKDMDRVVWVHASDACQFDI